MIRIIPAKNGSPAVLHGKTWLHSPYNPEAEAEKYIGFLNIDRGVTHFILIECALGYLVPALKAKFPDSVIISLHCDARLHDAPDAHKGDFNAGPSPPETIRALLEKAVPENAVVKIIEWRPSLAVYQEGYRSLLAAAAGFVKFHRMNKRTSAYFAKIWRGNVIRNTGAARRFVFLKDGAKPDFPVVAAAAGPGLAHSLGELHKKRESIYLIAVASALKALYDYGIKPDMIVTTDGGFWARQHLYELRRQPKPYPVIAAALNASLPSFLEDAPVLPISDGSGFQNERLSAFHIPFITLPQRGTVSAAALDLAFYLTDGPVYITGLDLGCRDIIGHVSPHTFETLLRAQSGRLAPFYHLLYTRALAAAETDALGVYRSWFANHLSLYAHRLIALGSNNPLFTVPRAAAIDASGAKGEPAFETAPYRDAPSGGPALCG
jgi:hypothetical protein